MPGEGRLTFSTGIQALLIRTDAVVPTVRLSLTPRVEWDLAPATVHLNTDTDLAGAVGLDMVIGYSKSTRL